MAVSYPKHTRHYVLDLEKKLYWYAVYAISFLVDSTLFLPSWRIANDIYRRIPNYTPWPGSSNFNHLLNISPSTNDALHTYNQHTGHLHTRGVQGVRSEILSHDRGWGWGRSRCCISQSAAKEECVGGRMERSPRGTVGARRTKAQSWSIRK